MSESVPNNHDDSADIFAAFEHIARDPYIVQFESDMRAAEYRLNIAENIAEGQVSREITSLDSSWEYMHHQVLVTGTISRHERDPETGKVHRVDYTVDNELMQSFGATVARVELKIDGQVVPDTIHYRMAYAFLMPDDETRSIYFGLPEEVTVEYDTHSAEYEIRLAEYYHPAQTAELHEILDTAADSDEALEWLGTMEYDARSLSQEELVLFARRMGALVNHLVALDFDCPYYAHIDGRVYYLADNSDEIYRTTNYEKDAPASKHLIQITNISLNYRSLQLGAGQDHPLIYYAFARELLANGTYGHETMMFALEDALAIQSLRKKFYQDINQPKVEEA